MGEAVAGAAVDEPGEAAEPGQPDLEVGQGGVGGVHAGPAVQRRLSGGADHGGLVDGDAVLDAEFGLAAGPMGTSRSPWWPGPRSLMNPDGWE